MGIVIVTELGEGDWELEQLPDLHPICGPQLCIVRRVEAGPSTLTGCWLWSMWDSRTGMQHPAGEFLFTFKHQLRRKLRLSSPG